jgi:hypothetical protein
VDIVIVDGPFKYRLEYRDRCLQSITDEKGHDIKFVSPMTKVGFKLYIICHSGIVLYVGVTNRPIRERLRFGEHPDGTSGYHGYKWMEEPGFYDLFTWNVTCDGDDPRIQIETLEAEIVFTIRTQTGQWPSGQTEIHFHESNEKDRALSLEMLSVIDQYYATSPAT